VEKVCRDLQASGYLALAVTHRLAQCGRISGQDPNYEDPLSGRPPQQIDDIKSLIKAARSLTSLCNGDVGVIGGSAGGSHAVFVALDKTASPANTYPNWCQNGEDDRPLCAVGLSGAYDLSDRLDQTQSYVNDNENYTNTSDRITQRSFSPVAKVRAESEQTFMPLYLVNSDGDSMPPHQIEDMRCALVGAGINSNLYTVKTITQNFDHAFALWSDRLFQGGPKVRDKVLEFLDDHVKNPP
jgi:acetyl esterase/lipase